MANRDLNYKRNVNVWTNGNPESTPPHQLQTVGIGKPSAANIATPDVVGMILADAITALTAVLLATNSYGLLSGTVASQSTVATTLVRKGQSVSIILT